MLKYVKLANELNKCDEYAIIKLAIYHEISSANFGGMISNKKISKIVDYLHNVYFSNGDMDYLYPKVAGVALEICNGNLPKLYDYIEKDGDELEGRILDLVY